MPFARIAIIGAGFCGLATAYNFSKKSGVEVHLFDAQGIGAGASGIAAGLLHPFVGAHSKLNWRGQEALAETKVLLEIASLEVGQSVASPLGMLRPAISAKQLDDFKLCADTYPDDVKWLESAASQKIHPQLLPNPGIFVTSALSVDCPSYLQGLWLACQKQRVKLVVQKIDSLNQLKDYDLIIATAGALTADIQELSHIKLQLFKGQVLELRWPNKSPKIPFPINSQAYLLMNPNGTTCTAGATYESRFTDGKPDLEYACADILPKLSAFLPIFSRDDIVDCKAGIRAVAPSKRPMVEQVTENCWIFTGMGPKGLLYHALLAKELAQSLS